MMFFKIKDKKSNLLRKKDANGKRQQQIKIFFAFIFFILAFGCLITEKFAWLGTVLLVVCYIYVVLWNIDEALNSLRGFLVMGMMQWFVITLFILVVIEPIFKEILPRYKGMEVIIGYIVIFITWMIYSLLADVRVAQMGNQILSSFFALLAILKDAFMAILPYVDADQAFHMDNEEIESIVEMTYGFAIGPILAINIITLLLVSMKAYWMEKERNRKDNETK